MSGRKIVFLGDCQAQALMQIYRDFVTRLSGDSVQWINSWDASEASLQSIKDANAVVSQLFNVERKVTAAGMSSGAMKVEFPAIFIGFLWPFSGQTGHVRNAPTARLVDGPYPAQLGDTYLNTLIRQGVTAEDASNAIWI